MLILQCCLYYIVFNLELSYHFFIYQIPSLMNILGSSQVLHHFKIFFPIPVQKVQNCIKKLQNLNRSTTSAVCISLNGHSESPQSSQLLYESLLNMRDHKNLSIFSFLQDKATSLTYFTALGGQKIIANPYCLIGDVAVTQKTYRNISRLLDLLGLKYEQSGNKSASSQIWNQFVQKTQKQKQITQKWLNVVESNMLNEITKRRKIHKEQIISIKNKVYHPQDALKLKLIDQISTFQKFVQTNFPNHYIEDYFYRIEGTRVKNILTPTQINALNMLMEALTMPNVALLSAEDPVLQSFREIVSLIENRLTSDQGLQEIDNILQSIFQKLQGQLPDRRLIF